MDGKQEVELKQLLCLLSLVQLTSYCQIFSLMLTILLEIIKEMARQILTPILLVLVLDLILEKGSLIFRKFLQ
jgi:hypothetical protein